MASVARLLVLFAGALLIALPSAQAGNGSGGTDTTAERTVTAPADAARNSTSAPGPASRKARQPTLEEVVQRIQVILQRVPDVGQPAVKRAAPAAAPPKRARRRPTSADRPKPPATAPQQGTQADVRLSWGGDLDPRLSPRLGVRLRWPEPGEPDSK